MPPNKLPVTEIRQQLATSRRLLSVRIRPGQSDDASRLAVLATQVWLHTYATDGITVEIAQYVLSELAVARFTAFLGEPETSLLVAEYGECLVGFAAVKFGASCPSVAGPVVELQTLYVQEHFIGQGIGRSLLQAAEAVARARTTFPLWLTVNAKNAQAIAFYARQGYSKAGTTYFVLGELRHENHVLVGYDALPFFGDRGAIGTPARAGILQT